MPDSGSTETDSVAEPDGCLSEIARCLWTVLIALLLAAMFSPQATADTSLSGTKGSNQSMEADTPVPTAISTRAGSISAGPTSTPTPKAWLCETSETTPVADGFKVEVTCKPDDSKG